MHARKGSENAPPTPTDAELARYLAAMCAELRGLADRPRLRTIRYLLDMARLEAEREAEASRQATPPQSAE